MGKFWRGMLIDSSRAVNNNPWTFTSVAPPPHSPGQATVMQGFVNSKATLHCKVEAQPLIEKNPHIENMPSREKQCFYRYYILSSYGYHRHHTDC